MPDDVISSCSMGSTITRSASGLSFNAIFQILLHT
jgi:hypothetical protein